MSRRGRDEVEEEGMRQKGRRRGVRGRENNDAGEKRGGMGREGERKEWRRVE